MKTILLIALLTIGTYAQDSYTNPNDWVTTAIGKNTAMQAYTGYLSYDADHLTIWLRLISIHHNTIVNLGSMYVDIACKQHRTVIHIVRTPDGIDYKGHRIVTYAPDELGFITIDKVCTANKQRYF